MQETIDGLNAEVERIRADFQKAINLNEAIFRVESHVASQNDATNTLGQAIAGSIEDLNSKISQGTVPLSVYKETLSKVEQLQQSTVGKADYVALQKKYDELAESMKSMVPRDDYFNLQGQFANYIPKESFDMLQKTLSQYVPREQLIAAETRLHELEARMENYVPRSEYDELTAKIALLTKEASALSVEVVDVAQPEPSMSKVGTAVSEKPEITEIQSQLSEMKGGEDSVKTVDASQGFAFANTTLCATNGLEFLQDLEQAPIESIENHVKSGDFERWFKDVLTDDATAKSLKTVREGNYTGDELKTKLVAVISPRYAS